LGDERGQPEPSVAALDEASRLPEEYPGWMTKMMARYRDHMQQ
jgi:hypothetical protein